MKPSQLRMKVEFENFPILDSTRQIRNEDDLDDMVGSIKLKLFGKR